MNRKGRMSRLLIAAMRVKVPRTFPCCIDVSFFISLTLLLLFNQIISILH